MCHDDDSRPPSPPTVGELADHGLITLTGADGTSFAAPIVTSVVAQMLEANPDLTPLEVKRILVQTARRLPHVEVDRQGWGAMNPRAAVAKALELRAKDAPRSEGAGG